MNALIDTHFLIWVVLGSQRLTEFPWLGRYRPWGVSPVSLLEIQYLAEVGHVADVVVLDLDRVADTATWTQPHRSNAIEYVLVGGQLVIERGEHTGRLPGKILRRGTRA